VEEENNFYKSWEETKIKKWKRKIILQNLERQKSGRRKYFYKIWKDKKGEEENIFTKVGKTKIKKKKIKLLFEK